MQQALKPRKLFIFARPLMQEEYEELEGIIDTLSHWMRNEGETEAE